MEHDRRRRRPRGRAHGKGAASRRAKAFWRKIRKPLAQSRFVKGAIASLLAQALRFVRLTNPLVQGSTRCSSGAMPS